MYRKLTSQVTRTVVEETGLSSIKLMTLVPSLSLASSSWACVTPRGSFPRVLRISEVLLGTDRPKAFSDRTVNMYLVSGFRSFI